jgi:hypothetical protein
VLHHYLGSQICRPDAGAGVFVGNVILNAARLWTEFSSEQKQRLQKALFPQGVTFAKGIHQTPEMCLFFKLIPRNQGGKKVWRP